MQRNRIVTAISVLALVALMTVGVVGTALAQTETPEAQATPSTPSSPVLRFRHGFGFGGGTAQFDAVAEALGLTPTQLFEELHSGKTLTEIAEERGVDLQAVEDAMNASRVQALRDRIAAAVEDGTIMQEQADWLLEGIDRGYLNGRFGFGFGFGGRHGRGMKGLELDEKRLDGTTSSMPLPGLSS